MKKKMIISIVLTFVLMLSACSKASNDSRDEQSAPDTSDSYEESADIADSADYESYLDIEENSEQHSIADSTVTFSLKVDTASYSNVTRYINSGSIPPADAVKTEELINYFSYDGSLGTKNGPFAISTEIGKSPFDEDKHVAFVRVKTDEVETDSLPSSNLVFLIDTSGSMDSFDKLPLLKEAFSLLVDTLNGDDRVSIVTYAGSAGVVLDSAAGDEKEDIIQAINNLEASGSTAGADGINTAYELAEKNFMKNGNNRIILATDGDFNVGISDLDGLTSLISDKRETGVYLSLLGFGTGNLKDDTMETLSKNGNGNYMYINSIDDAKKGLVNELGSSLFTVADDVKAQIEFNTENVKTYRLVGYENRQLNDEDFDDDSKDAGEIGAGTDVVMMFELELNDETNDDELFTINIRYKNHGESKSNLFSTPIFASDITDNNSTDFGFACAVAGFGHILRDSEYTGDITISEVMEMAEDNLGKDADGYRNSFLDTLSMYNRIAD